MDKKELINSSTKRHLNGAHKEFRKELNGESKHSRSPRSTRGHGKIPSDLAFFKVKRLDPQHKSSVEEFLTALRGAGVKSAEASLEQSFRAHADRFATFDRDCLAEAICAAAIDAIATSVARNEGKLPSTHTDSCILCNCVIACKTLRDVLRRSQEFLQVIGERGVNLSVRTQGTRVHVAQQLKFHASGLPHYFISLTSLASFHRLFSWLIGEPINLLSLGVRFPYCGAPLYEDFLFSQPVTFGCAEDHLAFDVKYLDRPVIRTVTEVDAFLRLFPYRQVEYKDHGAVADRISALLDRFLARSMHLPKIEEIAHLTGYTVATLRRRLQEENTTLRALKKQKQHKVSQSLLENSCLAISEIGRRTGFSDIGAFSRSFSREVGMTPSAFRMSRRKFSRPPLASLSPRV